ncbi:IMPACT family protein [Salinicola sp. V024]|uniref:IMPACT family protein n=1 Tax=unclassified Salinicola TaxID=2634022 RepID=UPI00094EFCCB|nr:YigZ family protein [Salinicola sp. MH3R3-1]OLO07743.1 IMPACT family protein [Salinicola sp. MH3R3-1]
MRYPIPDLAPQARHTNSVEIEKSRFLCWIAHAPDNAAFEALLAEARTVHPDASHHCSAFIAGPPGEQVAIGFSDDGEPGGTAGRPMFQALEGSGMGQIGAVVTRYFGGTKLGTGGLVRAYTQAVLKALETLPRREFTERRVVAIQVDFSNEAEARHWLAERDIPITDAEYDSHGPRLTLAWPADDSVSLALLEQRLKGALVRL